MMALYSVLQVPASSSLHAFFAAVTWSAVSAVSFGQAFAVLIESHPPAGGVVVVEELLLQPTAAAEAKRPATTTAPISLRMRFFSLEVLYWT
jgi:hypothetical protein